MLRQVIPPLVAAYATFVAMVVVTRRRPVARPGIAPGRGNAPPRVPALGTVVGGFLGFLAIVLVFHVWLAGEADAFPSAIKGGAFLTAIAVVVSLATSAAARRWR